MAWVTDLQAPASRILDAEVAGGGVTDLLLGAADFGAEVGGFLVRIKGTLCATVVGN